MYFIRKCLKNLLNSGTNVKQELSLGKPGEDPAFLFDIVEIFPVKKNLNRIDEVKTAQDYL